MNALPRASLEPTDGWRAELALRFACDGANTRTVLAARRHRGPLVVQRPFYPEGHPCHVYVVHPPGGVVGGDELRIDVDVEKGAHALLTTPAATKFYRCESRGSLQRQVIRVAGDAICEWLPQETIYYRGARSHNVTRVALDDGARFIGWDISCLGLPARGESFDAGALRIDLELERMSASGERTLSFVDRTRLTGDSAARHARAGFAGCEAVGTLLAAPATHAQVETVRGLLEGESLAAVTLVDGVLSLRMLAAQAEPIRKIFLAAWRQLRPSLLGREACVPRIWAT